MMGGEETMLFPGTVQDMTYGTTVNRNKQQNTRWFKYDRDCLHLFTHKSVPVIFEPPCISQC